MPVSRRSWAPWPPPAEALDLAGWVLLPLRAFLGVTFLFAGLQKLANPTFFAASNPGGMHAQLAASARNSPLGGLLSHMLGASTLIGVIIAVAEVAIGLGTLLGLWARLAAIGGIVLSLVLFLTVSFHTSPYYTGADIVFVFAWTPMILAGAPVWSLDAYLSAHDVTEISRRPGEMPRRTVVTGGAVTAAVALVGLAAAGLSAAAGRLAGGASSSASNRQLGGGSSAGGSSASGAGSSGSGSSGSTTTSGGTSSPGGATPSGKPVGPASDVPVGQSAQFQIPSNGEPGIVIQLQQGRFVAYNAICPHQGCTVGYASSSQQIVCPCHGSEFNPNNGDVENGPATHGLTSLKVTEGSNGDLYIQ